MNKKQILKRMLQIEVGKLDFWHYCKAVHPAFFKESRPHLKTLCEELQSVYDNKEGIRRLMINMPPRHGKSFTLILFSQWVLGRDKENRVISVSYNETLSSRFSKGVRDAIETENLDATKIAF